MIWTFFSISTFLSVGFRPKRFGAPSFLLLLSLLPETDGTFSGSLHRQRQFSLSFLLVNRFSDLAIVSQPATHGRRRKERSMGLEKTLGWPTLSGLERKGKI